jgi:hypothetical protein
MMGYLVESGFIVAMLSQPFSVSRASAAFGFDGVEVAPDALTELRVFFPQLGFMHRGGFGILAGAGVALYGVHVGVAAVTELAHFPSP